MQSPAKYLFVQSVRLMTILHKTVVSDRRARQLALHLAEVVPPNKRILDIGCGNGRLVKRILELRPDLVIRGIDVECSLSSAITVTEYDGVTIPFDTDSWEICMANDVLHHCDDPFAMLREMNRVAKDAIVLKDHIADDYWGRVLLCAMDWIGNFGYGTRVPFNFLSSDEWKQAFDELGLTQVCLRRNLRLYPYPFTWLLDRDLHFVTLLEVKK